MCYNRTCTAVSKPTHNPSMSLINTLLFFGACIAILLAILNGGLHSPSEPTGTEKAQLEYVEKYMAPWP